MPRVKKLAAFEATIAQGYSAGNSLGFLASVYKVAPGTIRNILKRQGIEVRKQGRKKK